jgi:hypothetical protein
MAHVRKGILVQAPEWRKHLRPWLKRLFWKRHRQAERHGSMLDAELKQQTERRLANEREHERTALLHRLISGRQ